MITLPPIVQELIQMGRLASNDVPLILSELQRKRDPIEDILLDLGMVTERDLLEIRASKLRFPFCAVEEISPDPATVLVIPEQVAMQNAVICIKKQEQNLTVVISDPLNIAALDDVQRVTRCRLTVMMGSRGEIIKKLAEYRDHYKAAAVAQLLSSVQDQGQALTRRMGLVLGNVAISDPASDSPATTEHSSVIKAVNLILLQGLLKRSSDIHLIPSSKNFVVKYRVDGQLVLGQTLAANMTTGIISRIKVLANMDISERRLPQDGSFRLNLEGREINFRVASTPSLHGEKVVLRILDKQGVLLGLDNLGLTRENYIKLRRNIRRPNGIILIVGPTGSGKTTTLYSALNALNNENRNITTVEDPVEYQIEGITQIQVNTDIGLTFANILRSILRQDPDVVLLGEIRDLETAEIAMRASLTGHLVFTTLHANDAVSAVTRLMDMGVAPFLISSALRCVMSQRLIRVICNKCKEPAIADKEMLSLLPSWLHGVNKTWRGKGCPYCFNTGYRGRSLISEVLEISDAIRRKIAERASSQEIARVAVDEGMQMLFQDGVLKVKDCITTLEEIMSFSEETGSGSGM